MTHNHHETRTTGTEKGEQAGRASVHRDIDTAQP